MKNIRKKFGWSLNEYCLRRGLDASTVRHVVYNGVGKSFGNNKTTDAIKILAKMVLMLDKYSSSDLSNLHAVTQQYIQALTKKAVDSGLKTVNIKGVEYKIGSRKSGKGYAYKP